MDPLTAITTIQTIYTLIMNIYALGETVKNNKREVGEFAIFIRRIENKLRRKEAYLRQRVSDQTFPSLADMELADSLIKLQELLKTSELLLYELQLKRTHASSRMGKLKDEINAVRLDIAVDMHFPDKQLPYDHPPPSGGSQGSTHLLTQPGTLVPGSSSAAFPQHVQQYYNRSGHGGAAGPGVVNNIYIKNFHLHVHGQVKSRNYKHAWTRVICDKIFIR